jgi:hypothetical protein
MQRIVEVTPSRLLQTSLPYTGSPAMETNLVYNGIQTKDRAKVLATMKRGTYPYLD